MSTLRKLAVCYLVSVFAFGLAAGLRAWPHTAQALARVHRALFDIPGSDARAVIALDAPHPGPADGRTFAHVDLPDIRRPALIDSASSARIALDAMVLVMPGLSPSSGRAVEEGRAGKPDHADVARGSGRALTPRQARARAHLAAALTPQMRANFGLFIFVSKSAHGPLAQRMYVFRREGAALDLLYDWAVSTGREKREVNPRGERAVTATPAGFYQFDPDRLYRQYHSYTWDQDMPNAMFFNWQREGVSTGLAIHAAIGGDIARLGTRASAGCVHLSPDNARTLFALVKSQYRGLVPRFYIDGNDTMSSGGRFTRRADGSLRMTDGYRVLIDIEDYGGRDGEPVELF